VHYKPQSGHFLVTEKSARHNTRRSDSECQQTASSPTYDHPHRPTTCYHDFAPSSASAPFLTLVRLFPEDIRAEPDITNFRKLLKTHYFNSVFNVQYLYFIILLLMHPWPSCNGRTRNAVSMSIWVCTRPHYFYCPSPDFTTSIISVGNKQSLCPLPPHVGGTREKWGGISKNFRPAARASRRHCALPTCKLFPTPLDCGSILTTPEPARGHWRHTVECFVYRSEAQS